MGCIEVVKRVRGDKTHRQTQTQTQTQTEYLSRSRYAESIARNRQQHSLALSGLKGHALKVKELFARELRVCRVDEA